MKLTDIRHPDHDATGHRTDAGEARRRRPRTLRTGPRAALAHPADDSDARCHAAYMFEHRSHLPSGARRRARRRAAHRETSLSRRHVRAEESGGHFVADAEVRLVQRPGSRAVAPPPQRSQPVPYVGRFLRLLHLEQRTPRVTRCATTRRLSLGCKRSEVQILSPRQQ